MKPSPWVVSTQNVVDFFFCCIKSILSQLSLYFYAIAIKLDPFIAYTLQKLDSLTRKLITPLSAIACLSISEKSEFGDNCPRMSELQVRNNKKGDKYGLRILPKEVHELMVLRAMCVPCCRSFYLGRINFPIVTS